MAKNSRSLRTCEGRKSSGLCVALVMEVNFEFDHIKVGGLDMVWDQSGLYK